MAPARGVVGLVVLTLTAVTLAFPERVLRHVEGCRSVRPVSAARFGALVTAFLGVGL